MIRNLPRATPNRFYLAFDPDFNPEGYAMKFRLTYEGRLESSGNKSKAENAHEIRKQLHPQLKRLWETQANLTRWKHYPNMLPDGKEIPMWQHLAAQYERSGFRFVPLATEKAKLTIGLEILLLRTAPNGIIESGDVDGRLKTLFDGLRMPSSAGETGSFKAPDTGEDPFFVLLEDDRLVTHVAVETDTLFQPTPSAKGQYLANDSRIVITVNLKPYDVVLGNMLFL